MAEVPKRIERGELVEAKFWQSGKGVWMAVDEKTEARHFRERNVGCEEYGERMWVEKKQVWETGVWVLESSGGVGGLAAGGRGRRWRMGRRRVRTLRWGTRGALVLRRGAR